MIEHFVGQGIATRGVSRRRPEETDGWEYVSADLLDAARTRQAFAQVDDTTRLVFGAYIEKEDSVEQIDINVALLENTLDGLKAVGAPVEHVTLYQGMKFYGAHLGGCKTRPTRRTLA